MSVAQKMKRGYPGKSASELFVTRSQRSMATSSASDRNQFHGRSFLSITLRLRLDDVISRTLFASSSKSCSGFPASGGILIIASARQSAMMLPPDTDEIL